MQTRSGSWAVVLLACATLGFVSPRLALAETVQQATAADGLYAVFETTLGTLVCRLEYEKAPVTCGNFVALAEGVDPRDGKALAGPFYDGLGFHRIVSGFIVQGGCPSGDGRGDAGYEFTDEIDPALRHDGPGVLSMASSGADHNGSQFFITLQPAPHLDGRHSVFGRVVQGMDVLHRMSQQPLRKDPHSNEISRPVHDIVMHHVSIVRTGAAARAFDAQRAFAQRGEVHARVEKLREEARRSFAAQLGEDRARAQRTPSGVLYRIERRGNGQPPRPGDTVLSHCTGHLANGEKFWCSRDTGEPFEVRLGAGQLVKGWEDAYLDMQPGERRRVIIPPELGYGHHGNKAGGVPPDSWLVLDVELLSVKSP